MYLRTYYINLQITVLYYKMDIQEFERQSQCEDYIDYGPEGYHPVQLGEKFSNNTYTVVQKLGWGHFSTVWLALNQKTNQYLALKIQRSKQSYTQSAIDQIQMLTEVRKHQSDTIWIQFLKLIQSQHPNKINSKLYRPLLLIDSFIHQGINGKHMCSVFQLMGPNLLDLIQHYELKGKRMPLSLVKKITRDVLLGLVYLHQRCNIIHTDLKPQNIMIKLQQTEEYQLIEQLKSYKIKPLSMKYLKNLQKFKTHKIKKDNCKLKKKKYKNLQEYSQSEQSHSESQYESFSSSFSESSQSYSNNSNGFSHSKHSNQIIQSNINANFKQKKNESNILKVQSSQVILSNKQKQENQQKEEDIDMSILEWKNVKIKLNNKLFFKIVDLGNACFADKHFTEDIQTRQYRSPQVILGQPYFHNADIFSLGCIVFEMMTNNFLFKPKKITGVSKDEDHLYQMLEILGPMDLDFCIGGFYSSNYFNENGTLINGNPKESTNISRLFVQQYNYSLDEAEAAEQFLLPMLNYQTSKRFDSRSCLQSKWLWEQ